MASESALYGYHRDYRKYLAVRLAAEERGSKSRLCKILGCHPAYLSTVLAENAHIGLEQVLPICRFLRLSPPETDYFLLLVHYDRAGSEELREYFKNQIETRAAKRKRISHRVESRFSSEMPLEDQVRYYSAWEYAAIHFGVLNPGLRNRQALARYFGIMLDTVNAVVSFLLKAGLIFEEKGELTTGKRRMHLPDTSPLIGRMHTNWRLKALESINTRRAENLHYTATLSLSKGAVEDLREALLKTIVEFDRRIMDTADETVYGLSFDFFKLKHD